MGGECWRVVFEIQTLQPITVGHIAEPLSCMSRSCTCPRSRWARRSPPPSPARSMSSRRVRIFFVSFQDFCLHWRLPSEQPLLRRTTLSSAHIIRRCATIRRPDGGGRLCGVAHPGAVRQHLPRRPLDHRARQPQRRLRTRWGLHSGEDEGDSRYRCRCRPRRWQLLGDPALSRGCGG